MSDIDIMFLCLGIAVGMLIRRITTTKSPQSCYLDGWICKFCGGDNPDESWPCGETTKCEFCGEPRPYRRGRVQ